MHLAVLLQKGLIEHRLSLLVVLAKLVQAELPHVRVLSIGSRSVGVLQMPHLHRLEHVRVVAHSEQVSKPFCPKPCNMTPCEQVDLLLSSPQQRAVTTAEEIAAAQPYPKPRA